VITRHAFLVGYADSGTDFLPGVEPDLRIFQEFLRTDIAGAWDAEEITVLLKPSKYFLSSTLERTHRDYALLFFAGHGAYSRISEDTLISINEREAVALNSLNPAAPRQLFVIDACRIPLPEAEPILMAEARKAVRYAVRSGHRIRCRHLFDLAISEADPGRSIAYSCSIGEAAGETVGGGVFTKALLAGASGWAENTESDGTQSVLGLPSAFAIAERNLANYPQHPSLENGRRRHSFPFAVSSP
jgi:hypothetical protein